MPLGAESAQCCAACIEKQVDVAVLVVFPNKTNRTHLLNLLLIVLLNEYWHELSRKTRKQHPYRLLGYRLPLNAHIWHISRATTQDNHKVVGRPRRPAAFSLKGALQGALKLCVYVGLLLPNIDYWR